MELEAIAGVASVALLGSVLFALSTRAWLALPRRASKSSFSFELLPESAQRFRDELDRVGRKQSALLASALVFAILFVFAWFGGSRRLLAGAEAWRVAVTGTIVVAGLLWGLYRLAAIALERRRIAFRRHANIAVGQALARVSGDMNRLFHDVASGSDVVDHVLVGPKGVFAIFVIARRAGRHNGVRARDGQLRFPVSRRGFRLPGLRAASAARMRSALPLDGFVAASGRLARLFGKAIGQAVRVRTVLVVPGWEVEEQPGENCLVVNERSLGMLRGWTERSEYLLNEDVELLHDFLAGRAVSQGLTRSRSARAPAENA